MADVGSLGEYKVVVTADYSQLQSQFKAMMDLVTNTTKAMTDTLNNSTKAMGQIMSTNIKTMVDSMNSAFSGADTAIKDFGQTAENAAKNVQSASQKIKNSGDGFKNYTKQIREAKAEMEKAFQKADELQTRYNLINNDSVHGRADLAYLKKSKLVDTARDLKEAKAEAERLRIQYDRLVEAQKRFKEYAGQTQTAQKEQIREAVAGANAQIKALDRQAKANSQMLQGQMRSAQQVQEAERRTDSQRQQSATRQQQRIAHLQTQYRVAYEEVNKYLQSHVKMSEAVFVRLQGRLTAIGNEIRSLGAMPTISNPLEGMNFDQYAGQFSRLADAAKSLKHHMTWMASAVAIGGIVGLPVIISNATKEFEALNTKIMQNLELADQYRGNHAALTADVQKLGQVAQNYAKGFGMSVNEVQEAMQVISRRFKDVNTATYLTGIALKMSRLDFVDTGKSARDLESVLLQFGMGAKEAGHFLNDFSVLLHTARINGTEMLDALERSGSAFRALNMNVSEAMAAIATLSTATGLTGSTIGMTFKSIATNLDTKKGRQALEELGIALYKFDNDGKKVVRNGKDIILELQQAFKGLNEQGQRNLAYLIAGGKYQANAAMALLRDTGGNFKKFLEDMKKLSSDEMTNSLLEKSLDTYATGIERLKASFTVLAQSIGGYLLPVMEGLVYIGLGIVEMFTENSSAIAGTIKALGQVAMAYVAVRLAMMAWAAATSIVAGIQAIYAGIRAAIMGVALAEGSATLATMAYNAVMTIKTGIMTVAAGAQALYGIACMESSVASGIAAAATVALSTATAFLTGTLLPLIATIMAVVAVIALLGIALYDVVTNWQQYSNDIQYIWNTLVAVVAEAVELIIDWFTPLIVAVYAIYQAIKFVFQEAVVPIIKRAAEMFGAIIDWVSEKLGIHGNFVRGILSKIAGLFGEAVKWINDNVSPAFAQFLDNTIGNLIRFAQKVAQIAADVKATIKDMLTIGDSKSSGGGGISGVNADYNPEDDYKYGTAAGNKSTGFFSDIIKWGQDKFKGLIDSEMGKSFAGMMGDAGNPYAATPEQLRGFDDLEAGGGGKGSKGKGSKGSKGAKEADNSPEAMGYRYLTGKGLDKNMVLGILANIAHESSFNPDATNGNHWGMIQWDSDRWGRFLGEYLSMRGMSQSDYYASDVNTKRTLQYDYIVHEMTKGTERGSYQKILDAVPSTPEQWAHLINMHYERSGVYSGGTDWERQKSAREYATRFERKNGEDNYTDGEKAIENAYKQAKKLFDLELQKLKYEREMKGEKVTALDEKALYEKIMFVNGKNPYALLEQAQKDYQKQLLEAAKYEAKRQEDIRKSTDTQVKAIEKMADAEIAFAKKLGLLNDSDVRKYEWEKNESNYAKNKPLLDAKLGSTVDMSKGTADDMLAAYEGYVNAKTDLDAKYYAEKIFNLSRDVDATMKALDEVYKLEQSYYEKRKKINDEEFAYRVRYATTFIDSLTNSIQSGLEGILNRTKSFAEAFRDIFKGLVQDIIKLFSQDFAERIKKWLSNAIFKPKATGNKAGAYEDIVGMKSAGGKSDDGGFNLIGWAQSSLSSLGGGTGKGKGVGQNPLVKALGGYSFASEMRKAVQPGMIALRNTTQMTINGMSNITQQGMQTISGGIQTGTQAMTMTWQGMEVSKQMATEMGNAGIVANSQATAATVQATTAQMMGWLMAVLALFSLFGGSGGGESTTETHDSVNLGRSPDSYYMTPSPVLQSTTFNVPSFDIGGNIEQDMFAMVHKNEMVLTPEQANVIRETAKNGGSLGGSMSGSNANIKSNIQVSTVDSRGFERVLRDYNRDLSKSVKKGIRNGYLTAKGLM